jgi:ABC-2 type transport system permease protein
MPLWTILGAQLVVTLAASVVGSVLVLILAALTYDVASPASPGGVLVAFVLGALAFAAAGILLGAVMPTARAAQGAGILLWFLMLMVAGAGPPPEVLPAALTRVADVTPLRHVVLALQDPWLGFGSNLSELGIVAGVAVGCGLLALRLFRWE